MASLTRFGIHAIAALALPAAAVVAGVRSLTQRDHPAVPATMDAAAIAGIPRPPIDPAKPTVVVVLGADLTEITDALGPYEMFARAGRYNVVTAAPTRQPTLLTGGIRILPHYALAEVDRVLGRAADIVIVPNLPNADAPMNRPVIDWIRGQAFAGSLIHSWCKGAMALAETGLLDGQTATAHWGDIDKLEKRYPRVTWVRGVRWVDRGQFVMSAGITSGIDASLRVLIRMAGDSVARRVAREIRYPNYHYALDPGVEQYSLRPADLVLLTNAAFRLSRPRIGIAMYDGVGEFDLSNVYDAHVHTMAVRAESVAEEEGPVVTLHGLTVFPSLVIRPQSGSGTRTDDLDRLIVPGPDGRDGAVLLAAAAAAAAPRLRLEYIHAAEPQRFGLEPVIEDLAQSADVPTARFALKRMEYRSNSISFAGPRVPWLSVIVALALALGGLLAAVGALKAIDALSESDRKPSRATLTGSGKPAVRWLRTQQGRAMSRLSRLFIYFAAVVTPLLSTACADSPIAPVTPDTAKPVPTPTPTVAGITLDAAELSLDEGASQQLRATARDAQGNAIAGIAISWSSSDRAVADVGAVGLVNAIRVGTAMLTASAQGRSAQAQVLVSAAYPFDLLYSVRTVDVFHEVFRLDVRQQNASAARLFPSQQWASQPRPSPDGSRIAYVCPNPIIGDASICVANRDGSDSRMIAAFIGEEFREPAWSPDGKRLAYVRTRNDGTSDRSHIWIVNADGSNPVQLTEQLSGNQNMPAWSARGADGTERIAFVQDVNAAPRIWTIRPDGGDLRSLGGTTAHDIQPAWSPDGTTIAFQRSSASVQGDIWLMAADGGNARPLMIGALPGLQLSPAWSPDGRLIAFTSAHESGGSAASWQVYTVWSDGSRLARRTFDSPDKLAPVWMPVSR